MFKWLICSPHILSENILPLDDLGIGWHGSHIQQDECVSTEGSKKDNWRIYDLKTLSEYNLVGGISFSFKQLDSS